MTDNIEPKSPNLETVLAQAMSLHQAGQLLQAEQLYRQILASYPRHAEANHNLGLIAAQAGVHDAALEHFKIAYDIYPAHGHIVLSYANALMNAGFLVDARKIVKQARQSGLDIPEVKNAQRIIDEMINDSLYNPGPTQKEWEPVAGLRRQNNWIELEKAAARLSKQYPRSGRVWIMLASSLQAQGKDHLEAKRQAAQYAPMDADLQTSLSEDLRQRGHVDEAETVLRRVVKHHPGIAQSHYNLGLFLRNLGRVLEAGSCFTRALELNPNFAQAYCALALTQQQAGEPQLAGQSMYAACAIPDLSLEAQAAIGNSFFALGQYSAAVTYYDRVLEAAPNNPEIALNMADALMRLGQFEDAEKCYLRTLELFPQYPQAHFKYGVLLQELGQSDQALLAFDRAAALAPGMLVAYLSAAGLLIAQQRYNEALPRLEAARQVNPNDPMVACSAGLALAGLGQLEQAAQCYQAAIRFFPGFAFAYANLGEVLVALGQADAARSALEQALQLDPADPRIMVIALRHIPYRSDDPCFANLEAVYAKRSSYRRHEQLDLGRAYAQAMASSGAQDKADAANAELEQLTQQG